MNKDNFTHLGHSAVVRGGQGFVPRRRPRRRGRLAAAVGVRAVACTARLLLLLLKLVFTLILGVVKAAGVGAHQLKDREPEAGSVDEVLAAGAEEQWSNACGSREVQACVCTSLPVARCSDPHRPRNDRPSVSAPKSSSSVLGPTKQSPSLGRQHWLPLRLRPASFSCRQAAAAAHLVHVANAQGGRGDARQRGVFVVEEPPGPALLLVGVVVGVAFCALAKGLEQRLDCSKAGSGAGGRSAGMACRCNRQKLSDRVLWRLVRSRVRRPRCTPNRPAPQNTWTCSRTKETAWQGRQPTLAGIDGHQAQLPRQLLLLCLAVLLLFLPFAAGRRCTAQPHHATLFLIFSAI